MLDRLLQAIENQMIAELHGIDEKFKKDGNKESAMV
jgi:hypothetical protein